MWIKYKGKRINLSNQTQIKSGIKFTNELIFSDYKYKLSFENMEQRDKALELIDTFINNGCYQPYVQKYYLLDLDKELNE
ncbi:hypothetical protein [Spiroplasma endosymbiont of Ammophila pubescens]|uniref:hypothetical protein n=1 Tax=Spiroplasma endosymbiont of Ammophila pubescens TaxID=3066315 RepID=UPI0032B17015